MVATIILPILEMLIEILINNTTGIEMMYSLQINFSTIILGIILLFISKIFEYGVQLQNESDELI